jgi:hypothetical protein
MGTGLVAVVVAVLACHPCAGADCWVATTGKDTAPGTEAEPFKTITHAVEALQPGDTAWVRAGRYEENVVVPARKSGAEGKWVTISAAPGDERKVVVGTVKPRVDAYGSNSSAFSLQKADYVRLRGFTCLGVYRGRGSGIGANGCQHIEIFNCIVTGGGQGGVDANKCDYVTIEGVEAYFNGGGSGWSSGISLFEPRTKENVIRNCVSYGNYDRSSWRSDGNGIIIDNGYEKGGALLVNNLCFMNGGKGISSTRTDSCIFINNTCVADCWEPVQQKTAHEFTIRGAHNTVRNNIGVSVFPEGAGMMFLSEYSGPAGKVTIDPKTVTCDHNLFFCTAAPTCVALAGDRRQALTLDALGRTMPRWAAGMLCVDPGFADVRNLDFRLRPDSPALKAGVAAPEAPADLLGRARPQNGARSLGCYEGAYDGKPVEPRPQPGVVIPPDQDRRAIEALLANRYDLEWHGMLWGWGEMLPEELPLHVAVEGPRKADFLNLSGGFVLRELLDRIAREHEVRLVLTQPADCKGLPAAPHVISRRLMIRPEADEAERAFVRKMLRARLWTDDPNAKSTLAELRPALSAALGVGIEASPKLPADRKFVMITRNMQLGSALTDLAERMDVTFTLSRSDPLADAAKVREVSLDKPFGDKDGLVEVTVERPDPRGRVDVFARVGEKSCLCARLFNDNSRLLAPPGIDSKEAGPLFHKADTRLDANALVRFAVVGSGCALNVGNEWVLLSRVPADAASGGFLVRAITEWVKVSKVRFVPL